MTTTAPFDRDELLLLAEPAPASTPERRHLRLAEPAPRARRRVGFSPLAGALVSVAIVLAILATQLGLSIAISQGAYESRALETEQRELIRVQRVLEQNVDKLSSPQNLADNAVQLGMVQNAHPASLRLSDGVVLGDLTSTTSDVVANLVPNATLASMPVVDAEGLLVPRDAAAAAAETPAEKPVAWSGRLPAPDTH